METLEPILAQHPFLKGMERRHLELLVGYASSVRFDAGKFLFREGEEANRFYFIRHGRVAIEVFSPQRGSIAIESLTEGDVLGWSWLIPPYRYRFSAKAVENTRLLALDGKCLREKCEKNSDLGYQLLKRLVHVLTDRLEATRLQLLDIYNINSDK